MTIAERKTWIKNILTGILMGVLIVIPAVSVLLFSANYSEIYRQPELKDAAISLKDFDLKKQTIDLNLQGEWELYYNQWIVTDRGQEAKCDGKIALPAKLSSFQTDGKHLPNEGYASYKITLKDVPKGTVLKVVLNNFRGSFRAFIDNETVAVSGTPSKEKTETNIGGRVKESHPYTAKESGDYDLVVEVSASNHGGLYIPVWLSTSYDTRVLGKAVTGLGSVIPIAIFVLLLFTLILDVSVNRYHKNISTVLLTLFMLLHAVTTRETSLLWTLNFSIPYLILPSFCYLSGVGILFIQCYKMIPRETKYFKPIIAGLAVFNALCVLATFLSEGYAFQIAFPVLHLCSVFFIVMPFLAKSKKRDVAVFTILSAAFLIEAVDLCGHLGFGTEGFTCILFLPVIVIMIISEIFNLKRIADNLKDMNAIRESLQSVQYENLNAQALPHYAFNTLSCIKSIYRKDPEAGERALDSFCRRLRYETDYKTALEIPVRKELEECENYAELEKLKGNERIELLFDIEDEDFSLPQYSIFNLVENAYKHAFHGVEEPVVTIMTSTENGFHRVEVADNGCGMEQYEKRGHTGISNTKKRIELAGGSFQIESKKNGGTKITILLPRKEEGK